MEKPMSRAGVIEPIIKYYDNKFKITDREFNLIRDAMIDVCSNFESRTCSNCTGFSKDLDCGVDFQGQTPPPDFGCNKFTRK